MSDNNNDDNDINTPPPLESGPDDLGFDEGDDFMDDDWEDFDGSFDEEISDGSSKKKNSNFNKIVIAGAVVVGAGVFLMKMSAPPPQQQQQQVVDQRQQQQEMAAQQEAQRQMPPQGRRAPDDYSTREVIYGQAGRGRDSFTGDMADEGDSSAGLLNDQDLIKSVEDETREAEFDDLYFYEEESDGGPIQLGGNNTEATPPMPSPIVAEGNDGVLTPMPFDEPIPEMESGDVTDVMAGNRIPRAPEVMAAGDVNDSDTGIAPFDNNSSVSRDVESGMAQPVDNNILPLIDQKLGLLFDRLDEMEDEFQRSAAVSQNEIGRLRDSVKTLESRLDRVESGSAPRRTSSSSDSSQKPAAKAVSRSTPSRSRNSRASRPASPDMWVLKAAQPGKAMVARKSGNKEIKNVQIGDTLAGIGTIQDIHFDGSKWVVRGSSGNIVQ